MNQLPPFVHAKAFWEAVSFILAGILGLLVYFQVIPPVYGLGAGIILAGILAALKFLGINVELRLKAMEREFTALKNRLQ